MQFIAGTLTFIICLLMYNSSVLASNVFFVKKNIKMQNDQESEHDYYINAGSKAGLKKGMLIEVKRKIPFQDTSMLKSNEQLEVSIVELQLIHVQGDISVGRVYRALLDSESPIVDYDSVMIGDHIDLGSKKWPAKKAEVDSAPKEKDTRSIAKEAASKKTESISLSSKNEAPKEMKKERGAVDIQKDQRAENLPIGGELSAPTGL